ncbi:hypothetical protein FDG2_5569 [Candidatus Protofrankia californiensis]|uniref:Uncharacterized protein n=1 Tax=Candidatus Protofrankia californiensis TaxID=1839754 RepID=A0A1C3PEG6_9ACTN|nr:hypothetical protein FDG2_5569 [Candidatus Protofrankia californiensis]
MAPDPGQYSWQKTADSQCGVIAVRTALAAGMSRSTIRWRLKTGRWQLPMPGALVTHPEPPTRIQLLWCAVESIGPHAVLGGASAAAMGGLRGFDDERITVVVPAGRQPGPRPGVVIHHSTRLNSSDIYPHLRPPRTRLARSVVDMANWAQRPEAVYDIVVAAVQQRLVTVGELHTTISARGPIRRKNMIMEILGGLETPDDLESTDQPVATSAHRDGAPRHDGTLNNARSDAPSSGLMIPTHEYGRSTLSSTGTPLASHSDRT